MLGKISVTTLDDVMEYLQAAETLDLGVELHNEWTEEDEDGVRTLLWVLTFTTEPKEVVTE